MRERDHRNSTDFISSILIKHLSFLLLIYHQGIINNNILALIINVHNLSSAGHMHIQNSRLVITPDSKVHGAYMGPTWVLSAPDGPHVGPMNIGIMDYIIRSPRTWQYWATNRHSVVYKVTCVIYWFLLFQTIYKSLTLEIKPLSRQLIYRTAEVSVIHLIVTQERRSNKILPSANVSTTWYR